MDVNFQRKLDRFAGGLLCRILSILHVLRGDRAAQGKPKNILVILLSEMGAVVLARPMLDRIVEKYPEAQLHALIFRQNAEVLRLVGVVPHANILTVRNDSLRHLVADCLAALGTVRRRGIDTVIDCELFSRLSSILSWLSGAASRVGFHPHTQEGLYRGSFINRPVLYNPYLHVAQQFLNLAEAIESSSVPKAKRSLDVDELYAPAAVLAQREIDGLRQRLKADFPPLVNKSLVLMYPGGGLLPVRAWPAGNYGGVAAELLRRGYAVGVIGLGGDEPVAREICSLCNAEACVDLTGYTKTVRELLSLFHLAPLLITNDGGPAHFASMTPIASIVLYGPETPRLYGPLDEKSTVLYRSLSCSPCLTAYNHRQSPCNGDNLCLKSIAPETVLEEAHRILRKRPEVRIR